MRLAKIALVAVAMIVAAIVPVITVVVKGQGAIDPATGAAPYVPIPSLSAEQRQRIYAVRVTDSKDPAIDSKTREQLEWPSPADIGGDLYEDKTADKLARLGKWLPNFVKLPEGVPVRFMVEKGLENTFCLVGPPDASSTLRLWQDPLDKTAWRPRRIDVLVDMPPDRSLVDAALGELLSLKDRQGTLLADLKSVAVTLKAFPLQDSFVGLPWKVGSVSRMFDGHVVRVEFLVGGPREPLRMRLYIGDKGMQVSIQGKQLRGGADSDVFEPLKPDMRPMPDMSPAGIARSDAEGLLRKLAHWEVSEPAYARAMVSGLARIGSEHPELAPMTLKGLEESRARVSASTNLSEEDKRIAMIHYDTALTEIQRAVKAAETKPADTSAPSTQPALGGEAGE
jgi:hypothetical protein